MQNDLVSIIIPTYKRFDKLERAVVSAINQTYKNIEIIITSDNKDDINIILQKKYEILDKRIKFLINRGEKCVGNWNNGLNHANGNFIKILFDDDWMNEDCVKTCVENIGDHNGITFRCNNHLSDNIITCGDLPFYGSRNRNWVFNYLTKINKSGLFKACVSPCAYLFRNKKIKFISNFDNDANVSNWGSGSDIIFIMDNLLSSNNNKSLFLLNKILVNFESHAESLSVKNNYNVLQLTKKGMMYGRDKHSKTQHMRMM